MATELGKAYVQIVPSAKGISGSIQGVLKGESEKAGTASGKSIASSMKGVIAKAAIGTAVFSAFKLAISEGGKLQQSIGGIETLFKSSSGNVRKYADQAYRTTGLSANAYMESVTSFSASLLQSLGGNTQKASKQANMAMVDMADNSNKMGTSMESIQYAYQGFAKQNYTMLDNLKLGYGGTKSEMQRLLQDAGKLTGQKYDISNLNDVYSAIHAIQGKLGITGTTAREAATTLEGSFNSMKAAGQNLLGKMAIGENIGPSLRQLLSTTGTFLFKNLIPMIGNLFATALKALPAAAGPALDAMLNTASSLLSGKGGSAISGAIKNWLPKIILAIGKLVIGLGAVIGSILLKVVLIGANVISNFISGINSKIGSLISSAASAIGKFIARLVVGALMLPATGVMLIGKLVIGILSGIGKATAAAARVVSKIVIQLGKGGIKMLSIGGQFVAKIATGLVRGIPLVISAAARLISRLYSSFKGGLSSFANIGGSIVEGIWKGISDGYDWIKGRIKDWVGNVVKFLKKIFHIGSPSKLMADEIGKWIPAGIAVGINDNAGVINSAMQNVAKTTLSSFNSKVSAPLTKTSGTNDTSLLIKKMDEMQRAIESTEMVLNDRVIGRMYRTVKA
jgi:phage-related protein